MSRSDTNTAASAAAEDVARNVAKTARASARSFADRAIAEAGDHAQAAKDLAAAEASKLAEALRRASDDLQDGSAQEKAVGDLADGIADLAESFRSKDVTALVGDVAGFARRNPAAFLGGAVALGFAAARFAKSAGVTPAPPPTAMTAPVQKDSEA